MNLKDLRALMNFPDAKMENGVKELMVRPFALDLFLLHTYQDGERSTSDFFQDQTDLFLESNVNLKDLSALMTTDAKMENGVKELIVRP